MQKFLLIVNMISICIISYQQYYIQKMEDKLFNALKATCETLNLIKKNSTVEEIIKRRNENDIK